jgi:hypothetical protein
MAILLEAPHSPNVLHPRVPPGTPPPNHMALFVCISYLFCQGGSPLAGPLKDAKEMKAALIGGLNVDSTAFLPLCRSRS